VWLDELQQKIWDDVQLVKYQLAVRDMLNFNIIVNVDLTQLY